VRDVKTIPLGRLYDRFVAVRDHVIAHGFAFAMDF
jgi:hypothetical protein